MDDATPDRPSIRSAAESLNDELRSRFNWLQAVGIADNELHVYTLRRLKRYEMDQAEELITAGCYQGYPVRYIVVGQVRPL